jgi:hypothetical protein
MQRAGWPPGTIPQGQPLPVHMVPSGLQNGEQEVTVASALGQVLEEEGSE